MRVAFNTLGRISVENINRALSNMARIRQQVATGRRFDFPAEDPVGAQRAVSLHNELSNFDQYRDSTHTALLYMESTQGVLLDLGERMREAKSIALSQANATADASTRAATAVSVKAIRDQLVSLLNTEVGGRHLFSGHQSKSPAFGYDAAGNAVYLGDDGEITFRIGPGQTEITNIPGSRVAGTNSSFLVSNVDLTPTITGTTPLSSLNRGAGIPVGRFEIDNGVGGKAAVDTTGMSTVQDLVNAINGAGVGVSAAINTAGDGIDLINFINTTGTLTITELDNGTTGQALGIAGAGVGLLRGRNLLPAVIASTPLANIPALTTLPPGQIDVLVNGATYTVDFAAPPVTTIGELVTRFNATVPALTMSLASGGKGFRIDGVSPFTIASVSPGTAAQDLGIAGSGRQARLFGSLEALEQALLADDDDAIQAAMSEMELVISDVVRTQGVVASRLQRLDAGLNLLDTHTLSAETRLSSIESTDMAEAITALTQAQTLYQTALATASSIYDLNLLRYLYP